MSGFKVILYVDEQSLLTNLRKGGFDGSTVPTSMTLGSYNWVFIKVQDQSAVDLWNGARVHLYLNTAGQEEVYKWGPDANNKSNNRILGDFIVANNVPCHFVINYLY